MPTTDRYTHGHHESVLRSHQWRTVENSATFLLPHLTSDLAVLDVGCGPGTVTLDLARIVSSGHVTGVDIASEVIDVARTFQRDCGVANVTFGVADVYGLAFEDESFDVVYAHQVTQHLSDPVAALGEMRRVLRAGGLLAVRDSDYGAFTWSPDDERLDRWMDVYQRLTRRNHVDANAGRHLSGWVRQAGFSSLAVSSSNWTFATPEERLWWGQIWADRVRESEFARQSVEYQLTTRPELDEMAAAFLTWANDVDGFFNVVNVEVLARP